MPSPYELKTRWLEWHERWPVPELESLKRQIETVKNLIAAIEYGVSDSESNAAGESKDDVIARWREVLATLERLLPPF